MKIITIEVADDFQVTSEEILEMFTWAQIGVVHSVVVADAPDQDDADRQREG